MILLIFLAIIAIMVAFGIIGALLSLGIAGGVFLFLLADLIACVWIIYCIIKKLKNRKKK